MDKEELKGEESRFTLFTAVALSSNKVLLVKCTIALSKRYANPI